MLRFEKRFTCSSFVLAGKLFGTESFFALQALDPSVQSAAMPTNPGSTRVSWQNWPNATFTKERPQLRTILEIRGSRQLATSARHSGR
jgi:hypothetical protein